MVHQHAFVGTLMYIACQCPMQSYLCLFLHNSLYSKYFRSCFFIDLGVAIYIAYSILAYTVSNNASGITHVCQV